MTQRQKTTVGIVVSLAALGIIAALLVPQFIDLNRYRPQVIAAIETKTGEPARIGRLGLRFFPSVSIQVHDFALGNPAGFPKGDLITTRRIQAIVVIRELWHHHVVIKSLEIEDPIIHLLSDDRGKWNYQNRPAAGVSTGPAPAEGRSYFSLGEIPKIKVTRGQFTVASLLPSGEAGPDSVEIRGFSSRLENVVPDAFGSASMMPHSRSETGSRPSLQQPPSPAVRPVSDVQVPARQPAPVGFGTLSAESLRVGRLEFARVKSNLQLLPDEALLQNISFDCYKGRGSGTVSVNFGAPSVLYVAQMKVSGVDMAALLAPFPDARDKMTGKMEAQLTLSGESVHSTDPLAGKRGTGQVVVRNGRLPTLQIKKNLLLLASFMKLGPPSGDPSSFSELSLDTDIAASRIASRRIMLRGNGVNVDGSGSLALAGEGSLDYDGVASVAVGQSAITNILTGFSGISFSDGKLSFPFTLAGTFEHPIFRLKSPAGPQGLSAPQRILPGAQAPGQPAQNPGDLIRGLGELFKKKNTR